VLRVIDVLAAQPEGNGAVEAEVLAEVCAVCAAHPIFSAGVRVQLPDFLAHSSRSVLVFVWPSICSVQLQPTPQKPLKHARRVCKITPQGIDLTG
jgi:phage tail protein X